MNNRTVVATLALLAILFSGIYFFWGRSSRGPGLNTQPTQALGEVLAGETARLLGGHGQIVVVAPDLSRLVMPQFSAGHKSQLESFQKALKKSPLKIVAVERLAIDGLRLAEPRHEVWKPEEFVRLLDKYPQIEAVVSFVRLPALSAIPLEKYESRLPKLVVVCQSRMELDQLQPWLASGRVQLAITPRALSDAPPAQPPQNTQNWFEQHYEIVRPSP